MKERLLEFLRTENKSSSQFAEEIGVQPSGISHILSGRNNPSLDFILKMLEKYQFLSTDWLLFGKGTMYNDKQVQSLFDDADIIERKPDKVYVMNENAKQQTPGSDMVEKGLAGADLRDNDKKERSSLSRIVMFYNDGSFEEYNPRN